VNHMSVRHGEWVILQLRPAWSFYVGHYMVGLPISIFLIATGLQEIMSPFIGFAALAVLISRYSNLFTVTNRRVVQLTGIIARAVAESDLDDIVLINVRQSIMGRLLNYGSIEIMSAANCNEADIILGGIASPFEVKESIWHLKHNRN